MNNGHNNQFQKQLAFGRIAESQIANWLKRKGYVVMPAYEIEIDSGKGPQLFWGEQESAASPDLLIVKGETVKWIEAKHKTVFTWHRITKRWTTGIDLKHYRDYLRVAQITPWTIWLLFFHVSDIPHVRDWPFCVGRCPTGLYAGELRNLAENKNHESSKWGKSGMVYWAESALLKLAEVQEVMIPETQPKAVR